MSPDYWYKQAASKPLYPELLWSRPENRLYAGKLLVVGGNAQGFASVAEAYAESRKAGIGVVRVLLPDSLAKTLGKTFDAGEFAPSTPSGSFGQKALAEILSLSQWADGMLLDGDLGRNSETAILLEKIVAKYQGPLSLSNDALDNFLALPSALLSRPGTLLVASFNQLQKIFTASHYPRAITSDMGALRFAEALHNFSLQHHTYIITRHSGFSFVAVEGWIGSMPADDQHGYDAAWQTKVAAHAMVWWLQSPGKPFEAIMTSLAE